mmetsp:Transcript_9752/g.28316  ORF Transcript_9752/g.28316 Transcript_9752/m.28316 type:complete len:253 (-) Transcript_9752:582-1340(-)
MDADVDPDAVGDLHGEVLDRLRRRGRLVVGERLLDAAPPRVIAALRNILALALWTIARCRLRRQRLPDDDIAIVQPLLIDTLFGVPQHDVLGAALIELLPAHQSGTLGEGSHLFGVHEALQAVGKPSLADHDIDRVLLERVVATQCDKFLHRRTEVLHNQQAELLAPSEDLVREDLVWHLPVGRGRLQFQGLWAIASGHDAEDHQLARTVGRPPARRKLTESLLHGHDLESRLIGLAQLEQEKRHVGVADAE